MVKVKFEIRIFSTLMICVFTRLFVLLNLINYYKLSIVMLIEGQKSELNAIGGGKKREREILNLIGFVLE